MIRNGNGSYYKIDKLLLKWFIVRRNKTYQHTPDLLMVIEALKLSE